MASLGAASMIIVRSWHAQTNETNPGATASVVPVTFDSRKDGPFAKPPFIGINKIQGRDLLLAVKCPLETSAKRGLARRLSPHNFVPIENMPSKSP